MRSFLRTNWRGITIGVTALGAADNAHLIARLDQLENQANKLGMPVTYASMMYLLRNHIAVVRDRLKAH